MGRSSRDATRLRPAFYRYYMILITDGVRLCYSLTSFRQITTIAPKPAVRNAHMFMPISMFPLKVAGKYAPHQGPALLRHHRHLITNVQVKEPLKHQSDHRGVATTPANHTPDSATHHCSALPTSRHLRHRRKPRRRRLRARQADYRARLPFPRDSTVAEALARASAPAAASAAEHADVPGSGRLGPQRGDAICHSCMPLVAAASAAGTARCAVSTWWRRNAETAVAAAVESLAMALRASSRCEKRAR